MRTRLAARKADDITLLQFVLTVGRTQRRLAAKHDHPFLVQVVRVVGPELAAGLDLGQGRADQLTADPLTDKCPFAAPAFAVSRSIPIVAVKVESPHWVNVTVHEGVPRTGLLRNVHPSVACPRVTSAGRAAQTARPRQWRCAGSRRSRPGSRGSVGPTA